MTANQPLIMLFWLLASAIGALLTTLDLVGGYRSEAGSVLRTKEWWLLWIVNIIVSFVLIYGTYLLGRIDVSFFGFVAAIIGYPVLLHAKVFTLRGSDKDDDKPLGFEYILQIAETLLKPGIQKSITEQHAVLLKKWRECDSEKLIRVAKDYIASNYSNQSQDQAHDEDRQRVLNWVNRLLEDAIKNPNNSDKNAYALYDKVSKLGGLRGIRWVLQHI